MKTIPFLLLLLSAVLAFNARAGTVVQFQTPLGNFYVELYDQDKPVTVSNFLHYVQSGGYTNCFFHRSVPGFVLQGGGYACNDPTSASSITSADVAQIATFGKIPSEADVNTFYSNTNGTLAMALSSGPNTATSEFYFNLTDNSLLLDGTSDGGPFTVFGRVVGINGTSFAKEISALQAIEALPIVNASTVNPALNALPVQTGVNGAIDQPAANDLVYSSISIITVTDTNRPTLTLTNPKTGAKTRNPTLTVTGKTSDALTLDGSARVPVTNVLYSLNGGAGTGAQPLSGWTNWNVVMNLVGGTNIFLAYAVDANGNDSLTNQVEIFYTETTTLDLGTSGAGTIIPNDNGKVLIVGDIYSLTAKPAKGCVFMKWANNGGTVLTTNATLKFQMSAGLDLVATFLDVTKPTASITSPKPNAKITTTPITATGKAADNVGVTGVWYQINGGGWTPATSGSAFKTWTIPNLTVTAGTNVLNVYAADAAGNISATNQVTFISVLP